MLDKMKQLYQLQKQARAVQKELKDTEIEAKSADGEIVVVFSGEQKLIDLKIGERYLDKSQKHNLEQAILKVAGEASSKAQQIAAEKTKDVMKGMGLNLPGM